MLDVWLFPHGITIYQAPCTGVAGREITPIIICLSGGFPLQILMFPPLVLYGLVVVFTLIHHGDVFGQGAPNCGRKHHICVYFGTDLCSEILC